LSGANAIARTHNSRALFLRAGKKRLAGDTARAATSDEVKDLRREAGALKEVVAEIDGLPCWRSCPAGGDRHRWSRRQTRSGLGLGGDGERRRGQNPAGRPGRTWTATGYRPFIVDGAKALSRAVRDTFGDFALIQRCQVHKRRNVIGRLDPLLHAGVKKVLRQAWDSSTDEQAERVLRNLARRLDHEAPGVSASILEELDEMLTAR
jgi:Transposase, Mutator family